MIDQLENPPKCKTQPRERLKKKKENWKITFCTLIPYGIYSIKKSEVNQCYEDQNDRN